eukprot:3345057-Prymnesium_polylepis.1
MKLDASPDTDLAPGKAILPKSAGTLSLRQKSIGPKWTYRNLIRRYACWLQRWEANARGAKPHVRGRTNAAGSGAKWHNAEFE